MENSIIFIHPNDTILSSTDGKLFKKSKDGWVEIDNILYKSEKTYPSNEGNNGDYFAKYLRKFNHFLYSEDFSQNVWNKDSIKVNQEPSLLFPINACSKITANKSLSKHSMSYIYTNDLGKYYTFSIYVKPNEFNHLQISLTDINQEYGYKLNANFDEKTVDVQSFGDVSYTETLNGDIKETVITYADRTTFNYFRIWLTAKFDRALRLSANITLLDENGEEIFEPNDETHGLFINSAQLALNTIPEDYIASNGSFKTSLYLEHLYNKQDDEWVIIDNNLHYVDSIDIPSDLGNDGDIATQTSIIKIDPLLLVGNSANISIWDRPVGTIRYSTNRKKWYVQARPHLEYSLEYSNPAPDYNRAAMAISLNQQTYQTYSRYCYPRPFHKKGICNTGGCYNDWRRIHKIK